jgi:hypothetical protein
MLGGIGGLAVAGLAGCTVRGAQAEQNNYAEIAFSDQVSDGTSVTIDRVYVEQDGFITLHTWELITQQDGAGTIIGVSGLLEAGENGEGKEYLDETVELFNPDTGFSEEFEGRERLRRSQTLIAVPHRDIDRSGDFNFTTEPHVDVPFTKGSRIRTDLPVDDAVNDEAYVTL